MEPFGSIVSNAVFIWRFAGTRTAVGAVFTAAATVGQELIHDIDIFIFICVLPSLRHNWSRKGCCSVELMSAKGGTRREYKGVRGEGTRMSTRGRDEDYYESE